MAAPRPVDPPRATRAAPFTEVPLLRLRGLPVVEVRVNGSGPYRFVVDWGANILAVSPKLSRELRLPRLGGGPNGEHVEVKELQVGADVFEGMTALVDPFFETVDADGVLGLNVYRRLVSTIDYPGGRFRLEQGTLPAADGRSVLAYRSSGPEEFTVAVEIAGKPVTAVLDTGASRALLVPTSAAKDFVYREPLAESTSFASGPQAGKYHPREGVLRGSLRIGEFEFSDPPVALNESSSFLIGAQVLEKFEISLDQENRRVRLIRRDETPIRGAAASAPAAPDAAVSAASSATTFPSTPLGRRVAAYFEAFNSGDEGRMKAFFEANVSPEALRKRPVADRLRVYAEMRAVNKRFRVDRVVDEPDGTVIVFAENADGEWRRFGFQAENDAERHLGGMRVEDADPPAGAARKPEPPPPPPKRSDAEAASAADSLASDLASQGRFSGAILLARNGRAFFEKAYGLANREFGAPCTLDTKFDIGSMNKFLTTIAIGQLAAAGKLALADPIRRWLPEYPNKYADRVTVAQLVAMRSGMGDFFGPKMQATPPLDIRRLEDYLPLFQDDPLEFAPGTKRQYSNAGFVVLGLIVQKASGEDYYEYVRRHILTPAGMASTDSYETDEIVPGRAEGYTRQGPPGASGEPVLRRAVFIHPGRGSSAGGGYSTVGDFLKLDAAFRSGKLLPPEWRAWAVSHDGAEKAPAAGEAPRLSGDFGFAGGSPGANSAMLMNFDTGTTVIVFSNLDPPGAESLARQIRGWLPK
jgi:CubicO group peptidase (beta-lactamase class C family)